MIHTAEFYINFHEKQRDFLEKKYKKELFKVESLINKIYKDTGITIHSIKRVYGIYRLNFTIDFIKLLKKAEIVEEDIIQIEDKIYGFIYDITGSNFIEPYMKRLDYRYDAIVNEDQRKVLFHIYKKTMDRYGFKKKYNGFDTTIYYNSRSIVSKVYDKERERIVKNKEIMAYEKNILRFEISLNNDHLNYNKRRYNLNKDISLYLSESMYIIYFKRHLEVFTYSGDYYNIYNARKMINSSKINEKDKNELIEFLKYISKKGVTEAKEKYSSYYFKKYITYLKELKINPILIPKNLKGASSYIKNPFNICA